MQKPQTLICDHQIVIHRNPFGEFSIKHGEQRLRLLRQEHGPHYSPKVIGPAAYSPIVDLDRHEYRVLPVGGRR